MAFVYYLVAQPLVGFQYHLAIKWQCHTQRWALAQIAGQNVASPQPQQESGRHRTQTVAPVMLHRTEQDSAPTETGTETTLKTTLNSYLKHESPFICSPLCLLQPICLWTKKLTIYECVECPSFSLFKWRWSFLLEFVCFHLSYPLSLVLSIFYQTSTYPLSLVSNR